MLAEAVCADLGLLILDKNLDFALDAAPGCIVRSRLRAFSTGSGQRSPAASISSSKSIAPQ